MLGGSGGGGGGGGGIRRTSDGSGPFDCRNVRIQTILQSPIPEVLRQLNIGDVLQLDVEENNGPLLARYNGEIAGSVTPANLVELIECIEQGHIYIAEVLSIDGARCEVGIRNEIQ